MNGFQVLSAAAKAAHMARRGLVAMTLAAMVTGAIADQSTWPDFWRGHTDAQAVELLDKAFTALQSENIASPSQKVAFERAAPVLRQLLEASASADQTAKLRTGRAWFFLGELYSQLDENEQCRWAEHQGVTLLEQALPGDSVELASALGSHGNTYRMLGRHEDALPLYTRALAMSESALGAEAIETGERLNDLAGLYRAMGQYAKARPLYQRALDISERFEGFEHANTGIRLNNLAALYHAMGQYELARPMYERALRITEKAKGREHPWTARRLKNLAALYESMGLDDKALPLLERALSISEKADGLDRPTTVATLNDLAWLHQSMGQYSKALPLYERALAIAERAKSNELSTVKLLNDMASLHQAMDHFDKALLLYQRAWAIAEANNSPELKWRTLNNLMTLYGGGKKLSNDVRMWQSATAIAYGKQAVNALRSMQGKPQELDKAQQSALAKSHRFTYEYLANLLTSQGRVDEAQEVLQMLKVQDLGEAIGRSAQTDQRAIPTERTGSERKPVPTAN